MPIVIKDYTWEETESTIFITVPLKGVKTQKVDVFSTEEYIKISFPPYFFECFTFAPVNDEQGSVQIGNGVVIFKLRKQSSGLWGQLQHPDKDDKEKARQRRQAAVERGHERTKERETQKEVEKRERQSYAVQEQMKLEHEEKKRIQAEKDAETRKATEELERWKEEQKRKAQEEKDRLLQEHKDRIQEELQKENQTDKGQSSYGVGSRRRNKKKNIFEEAADGQSPREAGTIKVTFSHRDFPTAARESTAPEEEEWLRKQAESRRIRDLEDSDLTEEEKNPVWMRDKGNEFFKSGNYQAAVNAYTHAIRLDYKMPSLYSNRAACHLKLRNFFKAIEDCQRALELLVPPVPQNAANRVRAHVRRGTAFCGLEMYAEGLMDYEAALKIDPNNETLRADAVRIRQEVQGEPVR